MPGYLYEISASTGYDKMFLSRQLVVVHRCGILIQRMVFLILTGLLVISSQLNAKKKYYTTRQKFEVNLGYGFPEAIGLKLKFGNQIQAGLVQALDSRGFGPTGLEFYYHLGEKPRLLDQSPWYVMGGFTGYLFDVDYNKEYNYMFYPRAGRSLYITRNAGIKIDLGPGFPLGRNKTGNLISPIVFTGNLTIFLRF